MRYYLKTGWINIAVRPDYKVGDDEGNVLDLRALTEKLGKSDDLKEQKKLIQILAYATNENVPVIELYEKNAQYFINEGKRISGWPKGKNLEYGLVSEWRLCSLLWIIQGKLIAR